MDELILWGNTMKMHRLLRQFHSYFGVLISPESDIGSGIHPKEAISMFLDFRIKYFHRRTLLL